MRGAEEAIQELARDLVVEHGYAPLDRLLPEASFHAASFDACLGRLDRRRLDVLALLAWRGQDRDALAARVEALRQGLLGAAESWGVRAHLAVMLLDEGGADPGEMWRALEGVPQGHFLEKLVGSRAVAFLKSGQVESRGRLALDPPLEWFEQRLLTGGRHAGDEAERVLAGREDEERRARLLVGRDRGTPRATWGLMAACAGVFALQYFSAARILDELKQAGESGPALAFQAEHYARQLLGANQGSLVFGKGEYWRLLASLFLHGDLFHLGMNMAALFSLGSLFERLAGPWRMLLLYLAAGLSGSLMSAWRGLEAPSVGASGAILGLAGALMALRWRRPPGFPAALAGRIHASLAKPVALIFGLGLLLNVLDSRILFDNWAHFGGLFAGFSAAWAWPRLFKGPLDKQSQY